MLKPIDVKWVCKDDETEVCKVCLSNEENKVKKSKAPIMRKGVYRSNILEGKYCSMHYQSVSKKNNHVCSNKDCDKFITYGIFLNYDEDKDVEDDNVPNIECNKTDEKNTYLKIGWCDSHYPKGYTDFIKSKTRKISQNANKTSLVSIGKSMYSTLDSKPEFLKVDEILVENQPALINPTMKSVAMILYSYFLMNCFHRRDITKSTVTNLSYCSASNKIKVGGKKVADTIDTMKKTMDMTESSNKKKVYNITKATSKHICKALISDNEKYEKLFNAHRKKDDLADSMLQAFVMNFKEIPEYYAALLDKANITDTDKEDNINENVVENKDENKNKDEDKDGDNNVESKTDNLQTKKKTSRVVRRGRTYGKPKDKPKTQPKIQNTDLEDEVKGDQVKIDQVKTDQVKVVPVKSTRKSRVTKTIKIIEDKTKNKDVEILYEDITFGKN